VPADAIRPGVEEPEEQPQSRARRWFFRILVGLTSGAFLRPAPAWARTTRQYATRVQETQAQYMTCGALALLFIGAYFASRRADASEERRIKAEVQRLVLLKNEFEETAGNDEDDLSDDTMAAALRAAQSKMASPEDEPSLEPPDTDDSDDEEDPQGD